MEKIPYLNPHKHTEFIGGVMVPPGEAREIDPTHHPKYRAAEAESVQAEPTHIVDVLLAGTSAAILSALPSLAIEDVELLGELEQDRAARKEVLAAVAERLLEHAAAEHDTTLQGGTGEAGGEQLGDKQGGEGGEAPGGEAAETATPAKAAKK
ncbi:hypothetical protein [Pseudogulbenkiania sp. MAI-1]|uniref:hypothetical protein n=1 Tax=Pseudogulbenkiania sp. MAI-1 TaxID=990370 RepID=UPI00045E71C1|nr:hypothetical protein [Pseudogulbenkiania sp. MAI-1]